MSRCSFELAAELLSRPRQARAVRFVDPIRLAGGGEQLLSGLWSHPPLFLLPRSRRPWPFIMNHTSDDNTSDDDRAAVAEFYAACPECGQSFV